MTDNIFFEGVYTVIKYGEILFMGIQVNNEINLQSGFLNNLYTKVQNYTSQFLNTDTRDFASYLNENYESIDKNKDNELSKNEISASIKREERNRELQKLIDNNNLEKMLAKIDTNEDGKISYSETDPNSNVSNLLKSAYNQVQSDPQNWGNTAVNLTQNLCKNYYASSAMTKLATSAVSYLM